MNEHTEPADRPDLPSPDRCEQIIHEALRTGDMKGVHAALLVMAVQDPHRAESLLLQVQVRLAIAGHDEDAEPIGPDTPVVMRIAGRVDLTPDPRMGQWVVEYDPRRRGVHPDSGNPTIAHLVVSPDRTRARRFANIAAAHAYWTADSGRPGPLAQPLTAYTVAFERADR